MSGPEFFQTRMGQIFFESTLPELTRQLSRVATAMELLASKVDRKPDATTPKAERHAQSYRGPRARQHKLELRYIVNQKPRSRS